MFCILDAGRIELLHAENRVLRNRLSQTASKYSNLVPPHTTKCSNNESHKTNCIRQTNQGTEGDHREILTPSSLDNEIKNVAKALKEEKDYERQQNILRQGYNFDSVTDSEDYDLYEISSECTLPDNLSEELLEERNAFGDNETAEDRVDINVAKMFGNVSDLGRTLKFSEVEPSKTTHQGTEKSGTGTINKKLKEKEITEEDFKFLSDLTLSESDSDLSDIEEIAEYNDTKKSNIKPRTPNELDIDLTGLDSESSDDETEEDRNEKKQAVSEDKSKTLFELLKNEDNNMSRALLLAESGYLEDKVTGQR